MASTANRDTAQVNQTESRDALALVSPPPPTKNILASQNRWQLGLILLSVVIVLWVASGFLINVSVNNHKMCESRIFILEFFSSSSRIFVIFFF